LESPGTCPDIGVIVQSLLHSLPEEQREMIVLHIWGQMTFEEAAETLALILFMTGIASSPARFTR
jgi:hypothetical protein